MRRLDDEMDHSCTVIAFRPRTARPTTHSDALLEVRTWTEERPQEALDQVHLKMITLTNELEALRTQVRQAAESAGLLSVGGGSEPAAVASQVARLHVSKGDKPSNSEGQGGG